MEDKPRILASPALSFLAEPMRYKVLYGGRGGEKSWGCSRVLLAKGLQKKIRILCAREIQHSIADSVHKLLCEQIYDLGLEQYYKTTKNTITGVNGTEFIFKGLRFNVREVKSTEGIDICWVEEAQSVSEESWEVLIPTIRKEDSEIWITFNPLDETDPTYQRFVKNPPDNAIVKKVSWKDNPWFPNVLRKEMEYLKRVDYEKYLHVWEGEIRRSSASVIFMGKYVIEPFDTPKDARFYHGVDWGFAQDPTTMIRSYIKDGNLYIDREVYGIGVDLDDTPALFNAIETSKQWPIKADNSRPETINFIKKRGFNISGATKWQGSVEDGIEYMRSFKKIIVHPRCRHTADEFNHYSYKVDKQTGDVLPIIVDADNHCVAKGSLISTVHGYTPIEQIKVGEWIRTRTGYNEVVYSGMTGRDQAVIEIKTATKTLKCTPDHKVFVLNKCFVRADAIQLGDELLCLGTASKDFVAESVLSVTQLSSGSDVYDLTIQGQHEFFADGVLVHNCVDAIRYSLDGYIRKRGVVIPTSKPYGY